MEHSFFERSVMDNYELIYCSKKKKIESVNCSFEKLGDASILDKNNESQHQQKRIR